MKHKRKHEPQKHSGHKEEKGHLFMEHKKKKHSKKDHHIKIIDKDSIYKDNKKK